ncbi:sigma-70 family RNA polymerase sigma factor [Actinomycetospora cinnamomea]|uniref:RNA polymerase sigma (SigZ) subunit n=1 Tax=Actinomycetospora cinnamomea TaxID=663609 RepID=A0A2U1FRF7_9PSEU|nr:sigma-70 family RNA polymerase sigma factor [Actinomycetospora cinnamomea]PVZ14758.1 RNA polymerase sigma (SigZ) subunit [Actinomycetospora cinnamomea]
MTTSTHESVVGPGSRTTEDVWREFGAQLRAFVHRRVADPQRAEDVLGEIVLSIHRGLGRVGDHEHLTRWVYRITRNAIVDEYRRAEREYARERALPDDAVELVGEVGDGGDPTVLRELAVCLRPLLDELPPDQRRALELTDLEGLTQADAAGREGMSVSGMKSRVQRGRRRLAELLGRCCELTLDARGTPMDYSRPAGCRCG